MSRQSHENLIGLGFDPSAVQTALDINNGDFEGALSLLLSQTQIASKKDTQTTNGGSRSSRGGASQEKFSDPASNQMYSDVSSMAAAKANNSPSSGALEALETLCAKLATNPNDETCQVIQLSGRLAAVRLTVDGAGLRFLQAMGYSQSKGFWVLKRPDPAKIWMAREIIEKVKSDNPSFQLAVALDASTVSAYKDAETSRAALRRKPAVAEPEATTPRTRIRMTLKVSPTKFVKFDRFFAADDTISDLVHAIAIRPDGELPSSHSWELVVSHPAAPAGHPPFWWCHGWTITDVTLRPPRVLTIDTATKTLQGLELWPSAQLCVETVTSAENTENSSGSASRPGSAAVGPLGGGQYLSRRPAPSEVIARVTKQRAPVAQVAHGRGRSRIQSSTAVAAERELVSMGFKEASVKDALRRSGGDKENALEYLLR